MNQSEQKPVDLDLLERLEKAATKSEWTVLWKDDPKDATLAYEFLGKVVSGDILLGCDAKPILGVTVPKGSREQAQVHNDVMLVEYLRNSAPALIRELREARATIEGLNEDYKRIVGIWERSMRKLFLAEKAVALLTGEVKHWKSNHEREVKKNRELRDRPDLGDRCKSIDEKNVEIERLRKVEEAAKEMYAFISIMHGRGPECAIPATIYGPLGVPIKIGEIVANAKTALSPGGGA